MFKLMITLLILSVFLTTDVIAFEEDDIKDEKTCDLFQVVETDYVNSDFFKINKDNSEETINIIDDDFIVMPELKLEILDFEMIIPSFESILLQNEDEKTVREEKTTTIKKCKEKELIDSIIYEGMEQLGKPYVYGATGVDSFDCSMLVKHSIESEGISFPRTSREQRAFTKYIRFDELKRGDFVFWHEGTILTHENVRHVAIYLGDGKMLQATPPQVVVSDIVRGKQGKYNISYGRYDYSKHLNDV